MEITSNICLVCLKHNEEKLTNIYMLDLDKISYLEKLEYCHLIDINLIEKYNISDICCTCTKQLRISFNLRKIAIRSQEILKDSIKDCREFIQFSKLENQNNNVKQNDDNNEDNTFITLGSVNSNTKTDFEDSKDEAVKVKVECVDCTLTFDSQKQLEDHKSYVHMSKKCYECMYCKKEFKQLIHLNEHLSSHTGEKKFSCPICDKRFQRMSSQKRHMRTHQAPPGQKTKRTPFLCTVCGKKFPFSNGLNRHMRTHFGIRNFQCDFCNRKFSQSTHLHVHMRTHTGEKPYICDLCGEKFALRATMLKHFSKHQ